MSRTKVLIEDYSNPRFKKVFFNNNSNPKDYNGRQE